jgi:DhnA family fructose-bisphosphate aldolase class Ia
LAAIAYAAHLAAEMGANVIKVKLPSERIDLGPDKNHTLKEEFPSRR